MEQKVKAIPHNSKCRYGERGAAAAKPKAQIILDAAKVSAASGGNSEPKQGSGRRVRGAFAPKHDAGTATRHYRAFWQRRCRAAAAGVVLEPLGGNCAVLPKNNRHNLTRRNAAKAVPVILCVVTGRPGPGSAFRPPGRERRSNCQAGRCGWQGFRRQWSAGLVGIGRGIRFLGVAKHRVDNAGLRQKSLFRVRSVQNSGSSLSAPRGP